MNLQSILWSRSIKSLDLRRDKSYIIHHVLRYGTIEQIRWLLKTYSRRVIRSVVRTHPTKIYSPASFHLMSTILGFPPTAIYEKKYLATTRRRITKKNA